MNATKNDDFEAMLRTALADRAEATTTTDSDPYDRVTGAVRRDRRRRTLVGSVAGVGALVLVVGLGGSLLNGAPSANNAPAGQSSTSTSAPVRQSASIPLAQWPVRGILPATRRSSRPSRPTLDGSCSRTCTTARSS